MGIYLVDGSVAGGWTYESGCVRLQPFTRLPRAVQKQVDDEASRLVAFHSD